MDVWAVSGRAARAPRSHEAPRGGRHAQVAQGHHNAIPRSAVLHACGRRWGSADALLYGVLETCARPRADLRQISTSWSVFSYRGPAKNRLKTSEISELHPPYMHACERNLGPPT